MLDQTFPSAAVVVELKTKTKNNTKAKTKTTTERKHVFDQTIPSAAVVVELRPGVGPAVSGWAAEPDQAPAAAAAQGDQARAGGAGQVRDGMLETTVLRNYSVLVLL